MFTPVIQSDEAIMEQLDILCTAYLGQDMEQEYGESSAAILSYLDEQTEGDIAILIEEIDSVLSSSDPKVVLQNAEIEWNFDDSADQIVSILSDIKTVAKDYLEK